MRYTMFKTKHACMIALDQTSFRKVNQPANSNVPWALISLRKMLSPALLARRYRHASNHRSAKLSIFVRDFTQQRRFGNQSPIIIGNFTQHPRQRYPHQQYRYYAKQSLGDFTP